MVLDLSAASRERAMLATVAEAIVAAAVGKNLYVAVACPDSRLAFVGQLTRALHARGRACRYLTCETGTSGAAGLPGADREASDSTIMVITSGTCVPSEDAMCRVDIRVTTGSPKKLPEDASRRKAADVHPDADHDSDIVVDYHGPSGPVIAHIGPHLSSPLLSPQ